MPHFLLLPVGSHGDVHPLIGLGVGLKARGHRVTVITAEPFRVVAERYGLEFEGTVPTDTYNRMTAHPDLWKPNKGLRVVLDNDLMRTYFPMAFDAIRTRYEPGSTVAVGGSLAYAGRVAHDAIGIPFATVHLQPMACCSVADPPVAANGTDATSLPRPFIRLAYRLAEWAITDPIVAPPVNEFRRTLGLPPVKRIITRWSPSPQLVLGLFPDWFGPIPDGGPAFRHVGFVLFDDANGRHTPEPLVRFLDSGPPPVVFSFGSAMRNGRPYFDAAVEACRRSGVRGVLLGKSGEQIPPDLPADVMHADYAPFSEVFRRAAVVVHHGGVGTSAQAMRAGVLQLVMPMAFDQPDNATRMKRLGVARLLYPKRFTGPRVAEQLKALMGDEKAKQAARQLGERLRGTDGLPTACELLEELIGTDTPRRAESP